LSKEGINPGRNQEGLYRNENLQEEEKQVV